MPDQPSPYAPGGPIHPGAPTRLGPAETAAPPPKRKSRLPWILLAAGAAVLLIALTVAVTLAASPKPAAPPRTNVAAAPVDAGEEGVPTAEPTTTGPTLSAKDMTVWLKTTQKQCYGYDIGCDLTVEVRVKRNAGVPKPDPDDTWQVTYEITGIKDGPVIGSFEITGGQYEINEENLTTKSSGSKPTVKVTSVEKVGV